VTNLRDPVERIVSEYHYILKMRFRHPVTLANMTLREYATSYMPAHRTTNLMTKMLAGVTHGTYLLLPVFVTRVFDVVEQKAPLITMKIGNQKYCAMAVTC